MHKSIFLIGILIAMMACQQQDPDLPIYGHTQIEKTEKDGKIIIDTIYHAIPPFSFTDQDSSQVTEATFKDRIYVADFFFTSCPDICPIMKTQMLRVYEQFKSNPEVAFLSHTIDPKRDSVHVLKEYAERLGVDKDGIWYFVTGDKDDIYDIAYSGYFVTADESDDPSTGFIHDGAFILVDKERRIRGVYDGTKADKVDLLIADIPKLLKEYDRSK